MAGIQDKVVVITGASSGIGAATARHLAALGARVVLGARRPDKLAALCEEIASNGGDACYRVTDVKQRDDLSRLVQLAIERYGKLDVLISNAGVAPVSPLDDLRVEDWESMLDVNVKGVLYGIAAALPVFRRQGSGHFIHTLSTSVLRVVPTMAVYAGSKLAVKAISEGLRQEADGSLRVTTITPGYVDTDLPSSMPNPFTRDEHFAAMREMGIPARAIAEAIAFAIGQPDNVDVGDIVVRPTAQA